MIARRPDQDVDHRTTGEIPAFVHVPPPAALVEGPPDLDDALERVLAEGLAVQLVANGVAEQVFARLDDEDLWMYEREIADQIARAAHTDDDLDATAAAVLAAGLIDRGLQQVTARWQQHRELRRKYERRWNPATPAPEVA